LSHDVPVSVLSCSAIFMFCVEATAVTTTDTLQLVGGVG